MKNLFFILIFSIAFSCTQQKVTEEKANTKTEVVEKKTIPTVKKEKPVSNIPKPKKVKPALDTIIHTLENGNSLLTYIYEYHDTIPGMPVRRFVTMNEKDSIIIKSFDEEFEYKGADGEGDYILSLIPSYTITDNKIINSLVIGNYEYYHHDFINIQRIFERYVNNLDYNSISIDVTDISIEKTKLKKTILLDLKKPELSTDSLDYIYELVKKNEDDLVYISREQLIINTLLHCVQKQNCKSDYVRIKDIPFTVEDAHIEPNGYSSSTTLFLLSFIYHSLNN
ncbi:MAG: hypothetical protein AAFQ94_18845 [Bacteroidota bacterium]